MRKIPKLYVKNAKGRYDEYHIPELDTNGTIYQKINGKFVPVSMLATKDIPEGVWVVTRNRSCHEYINGKYVRECFHLEKASDIEKFPLSKVAHINKVYHRIIDELDVHNTDVRPMTNHELIKTIVGMVYKFNEEV